MTIEQVIIISVICSAVFIYLVRSLQSAHNEIKEIMYKMKDLEDDVKKLKEASNNLDNYIEKRDDDYPGFKEEVVNAKHSISEHRPWEKYIRDDDTPSKVIPQSRSNPGYENKVKLDYAKKTWGKLMPEIMDIKLEPVDKLLEHGYNSYDVSLLQKSFTTIFTIDNFSMWSDDISDLLLKWFTDYNLESGVFEGFYETADDVTGTIETLNILNEVMSYFGNEDWDFNKSKLVIDSLESSNRGNNDDV